jgi:hypothetical protein
MGPSNSHEEEYWWHPLTQIKMPWTQFFLNIILWTELKRVNLILKFL